ncbi:hypothetical protein [Paracoccus sp. DMF]|uniref:hypothetical protein n=1 Tax=Paracoccus sp. DMF TaxID=400837 RepID=UPI0021E4F79F|nr:hypothetical protein [Paracoccus sp. DMF]MCV2448474.1 hypothetical protein [Paracoccus sp. DMF]
MTMMQPITRPRSVRGNREMSIMEALHWAFATEKAQLDFDLTGAHEFDRPGIDPIWRGMQMATLGCAVDGGGGGSARDTAADAHIIASAVETLPEGCGGQRMALMVAELARAGIAPDWRAQLRVEQDGYATVRSMDRAGIWKYRTPCRHTQVVRGEFCPIIYTGTARCAAAKRREYLGWIGALYDLHSRLDGALWSITLTDQFPPLAPWRAE